MLRRTSQWPLNATLLQVGGLPCVNGAGPTTYLPPHTKNGTPVRMRTQTRLCRYDLTNRGVDILHAVAINRA
jgi:hypothetical protein